MKVINRRVILLILPILLHTVTVWAQTEPDSVNELKNKAVKVFIDCDFCDRDYIRNEIAFVNYVRDPKEAQVHILVTTQRTGSGGTEYTETFIGKEQFEGASDTLTFTTKKADTDETIRGALVRTLKLGLVRYSMKTPLAEQLSVSYSAPSQSTAVVDQWNYWVFSLSVNSFINGQQSSDFENMFGSISANRTTPDMKINLSTNASYNENNFKIDDTTTIKSVSRSQGLNSLLVFSVTDHWSVGGFGSGFSSTFSNTKLSVTIAPAVEYNIFPYSESTRRQLRLLYKVGYEHRSYYEETIYGKLSEGLVSEILSANLNVKEPWGSVNMSLSGSHYFQDFNKYNIGLSGGFSLRLIEGLSLNVFGNVNKIHDQLSLSKGTASEQEILLQRRQLETQYEYFASFGVSYSFGSIFNNVVNPRFGGSGSGYSFSFSSD
ncbi:MAG: hypothetical protein HYR76_09605 [Ignavibacteria bacterium]|nr:hypothetical protein [Ignavibacteria bacterium]